MKKMTIIAGFMILSILQTAYSQEDYSFYYGKISPYEATMTSYEKDEDAEAVVIYDVGKRYFKFDEQKGDFLMYMEKIIKIKILKQPGIKYGNFEIPYYTGSQNEVITNIEGQTYNYTNGQQVQSPLEKANVYDEKATDYARVKRIAMPNVREGSVVELRYTIITPHFFNVREWQFQKKIPVVKSIFEFKMIPFYEYAYILIGTDKLDGLVSQKLEEEYTVYSFKYKEMLHHFEMNDLPAFKDEEFITSEKDYMISLNFQLARLNYPDGRHKEIMSTWPAICDELLDNKVFGKYLKSSEKEGKNLLRDLNLSGKTQEEQLKTIVEYVKHNYNWNKSEGLYTTQEASDFIKRKVGNSAEINLFLAGLLKAAGIEVYPVALSTRGHGAISMNHPFVHMMNYVILQAKVNGKEYLVDGTEPLLIYDELPERCINVKGLVVAKKSDQWITITQNDYALTEKSFDIRFDEVSKTLENNVSYSANMYDGYSYRRLYKNKGENLDDFFASRKYKLDGSVSVENYDNPALPFIFSFKVKETLEQLPGKFFLDPFLYQAPKVNLFKQKQRLLPVDLICLKSEKYKSVIHIPSGYKVEYLPEEMNMDDELMSVHYAIKSSNNEIQVDAEYTFKQNIYEAKSYEKLKATYGKMVKQFKDLIVLVKE